MELSPLDVKIREGIGKSEANKIRREKKIPAILYGSGFETTPLIVELDDFKKVIHTEAGLNVILNLRLPGQKKEQTAIIKELQRDPIRDTFLHVDFMKISMDKEIDATVPIVITGESAGAKEGGVQQQVLWELEIIALPLNIPDHINVDVSELNIGDSIKVDDLILPEEIVIKAKIEDVIVSVVPPTELKEEELVAEVEEGEPELVGEEVPEGEEVPAEEQPAEEEEAKPEE